MRKRINIEGMSCGHCVKHVEGALGEVPGVAKVDVNLEGKYAIVELEKEVADAVLKEAVEEAGYDVTAVKGE
ncbi:MAG: copper ion binding protein [Clostridiaceae bacterium]|jgi:copper ion binding protein|nr:copper ion binding protein [Clostridiaceae bacterium]